MTAAETQTAWRSRIVDSGAEKPEQLLANPRNWRIHPKAQQDALAGVLSEVGWIQQVIVNRRTGHLIDGHLRVTLAMREGADSIPVLYVDLDESEEALALATIDPLSAMAVTDAGELEALLNDVSTGEAAVQAMLADLAERSGVIPPDDFDPNDEWVGMPEFENEDLRARYRVTVSFMREEDIDEFERVIGSKISRATWSVWFPEQERLTVEGLKYTGDES